MLTIPLKKGKSNCFYVKVFIFQKEEIFLIDTGFSSYLCLSENLKFLFPNLDNYSTFDTDFTLADSSKKTFTQYLIPELSIFNTKLKNILVTFNQDESIIGNKLLSLLNANLNINYQNMNGNLTLFSNNL